MGWKIHFLQNVSWPKHLTVFGGGDTQRDPWLKCARWPKPCAAPIYTHHLPPSSLLASTSSWPMTLELDGDQQQLRLRIWKEAVAFAATKGSFLLPRRNCAVPLKEFTGAISTVLKGCLQGEYFFFELRIYKNALKTNKWIECVYTKLSSKSFQSTQMKWKQMKRM